MSLICFLVPNDNYTGCSLNFWCNWFRTKEYSMKKKIKYAVHRMFQKADINIDER